MRFTFVVLMAALMLLPAAAYAIPVTFTAVLSASNENPPTASSGTGLAVVVLDAAAQTIQINVTFSNLTSNTTAAHIHCCILPPMNTGVATAVPAFPGFPLGVTSGTYSSQVFDLTQSLIYNPAFVTAQGGLPQAQAALVNGIQNGQTYLNVHTMNNPGGEIRGFLAVPEPFSAVLLGPGLLGLIVVHRRLAVQRD